MSSIKITQFGGLAPSVDPRNLPPDGAQVAENLDLRFGDFRPSRGPGTSVQTVPSGTQSIFRTPSGVWLHSATDTDYVNGQVPDAASERVYLTGRSGFPEAWQGGAYRRLGVPAPTTKPAVELTSVDEFDQTDADAAQQAATAAVIAAVRATETSTYLGNAPPAGAFTPVALPDPLYSQVALHLRLDELVAGQFKDISPQKKIVTKTPGVTLTTNNLGPLGAAGTGYAVFAGGSTGGLVLTGEIRRWRNEANPRWTIDAWVMSDVALEWLTIQARDGNMREILFQRPTGEYHCLTSAVSTGRFYEQLRCKRPSGAHAIAANTACLVSVQCTGATVEVYLDGELCGSTPNAEGLELTNIGTSQWTADRCWLGKIDEFRVTLEQRYTANFTPVAQPWSTAAVPTGFFLAHGAAGVTGNLPTDDASDAVYMVQLTTSGGGYVAINAQDQYLLGSGFGGSLVTYSSAPYWAVPVHSYRAAGKTIVEATLATALANVDNPAAPASKLLTSTQANELAAAFADAYDPTLSPVLTLLSTLNSEQSKLQTTLAAATGASAASTQISLLQSASAAMTRHFTGIDATLKSIMSSQLGAIFGAISNQVVTRTIDTRAYFITYVTDWDEESAPSPASDLVEADQNDSVRVTAVSPPAGRNIVGWRLYRSNTTDRSASWSLVAPLDAANAVLKNGAFWYFKIADLNYTDDQAQSELQEPCETLTWAEPPAQLKGLVGLPNGIMAGFFDNVLCFSEPFAPYAWPVEYQLSLEHKIVGIGVFGQTAVVLTEGHPYFASGADSASMSAQKVETPQACIAKRSIVSAEGGVMYASPDGLCLAGPNGVAVVTQGSFSKTDWQASVNDAAFAAYHDGCYYLFAS